MIRFLLKGLLRDRSRSLLPFLTVILGSMLTVVGFSWINGAISTIIEASANFSAGHVKVMTRAYAAEADQAPNDLAMMGVGGLVDELERDHPELVWTPRIKFGGLVDIPDENGETRAQGPAAGLGVDLLTPGSPERALLNLDKAVVRGRLPERPGEVLLSDGFAARLGVGPGSTATLIGATMYGGMVVHNFTVSGTVRFGITAMDRGAVVADIADVQAALDMEDAAGEVLGFERDSLYRKKEAAALAAAFNAAHAGDDDEFAPAMVALHDQGGLGQTLEFASSIYLLMLILFILVMSIVLWNAGLMGSLRRYGEFGIRLALGEDHGRLYRSLIGEGRDRRPAGLRGRHGPRPSGGLLPPEEGPRHRRDDEERLDAHHRRPPGPGDAGELRHRVHPGASGDLPRQGRLGHRRLQEADLGPGQGVRVMTKRIVLILMGLAVIAGTVAAGAVQAPDGEAILRRADENMGSDNKVTTSTMTIHGRRGSRSVKSKSWIRGRTESFTEYLDPPRERGTKMLKLEDQLWTYTPATDRTILISGHMLRQSVMGSDLSYEDMMEDPRLAKLYAATVAGEEATEGRPCWVLDLVSRGEDIAYHKRKIWVDKERYVVLREERFAKSGKLLKTTEVKSVDRQGGRWVPTRIVFKDALKEGQGTEFVLESIEFDAAIPDHVFTKASLR